MHVTDRYANFMFTMRHFLNIKVSYKCPMRPLLFLLLWSVSYSCIAQTAATVVIGSQEWMANNLDVDVYTDGTKIPCAKSREEWMGYNRSKIGCYCHYDNERPYGMMYGKLYNIYAIKKGLAPHCWRMPMKKDVDKLMAYLGATASKKLKATHSWNNDWNGDGQSGFNALAGGCRNPNGTYSYVGRKAFWWVWDEGGSKTSLRELYFFIDSDDKCDYDIGDGFGFAVRCMRDVGVQPPMPCP